MEDKYPQILIPEEIHSIKKKNPPLPIEPKKPIYPEKKVPQRPNEPEKPFGFGTAFLIFVVLIGMGFGLTTVIPILGVFLIGLAIYLVISWTKNLSSIHNKYHEDYNDYLKDTKNFQYLVTNSDILYNKEIKDYNNVLLPQYNADYSNYLQIKQKLESKFAITEYRKEQLSDYFSGAVRPQRTKNRGNYRQGVTEQYFLKYLKEYFSDNVYTDFTVIDSEFEGIPYLPDYVISIPEINLFIDVEIDEPYIGHDGTPIHYINGIDNIRNAFFQKRRWIIIRFAEIQIIKFPKRCCEIIKSTIDWIYTNDHDIFEITQKVENFNCWTKEEAHRLAFTRFRNNYLPEKLTESLEYESMELEKKFLNIKSKKFEDDLPF